MQNETTFNINVTSAFGENFAGQFTVRKRLTHQQDLKRDEWRRDLLGVRPEFAPVELIESSHKLALCAAHVKDGPSWWTDAENGLGLFDMEPVNAVYEELQKVLKAVRVALEAKKAEAIKELKNLPQAV